MHNMAWKDSIRDLWILANRPPKEIRFIYCDPGFWGKDALSWEAVRQYRKKHRDLLRPYMGTELTPPFEHPETERKRVEELRSAVAPKVGAAALNLVMAVGFSAHWPLYKAIFPIASKLAPLMSRQRSCARATMRGAKSMACTRANRSPYLRTKLPTPQPRSRSTEEAGKGFAAAT